MLPVNFALGNDYINMMRVYYFISANYALENIIKRRLKIARLNDLNDPFEFMSVDMRDSEIRKAFRKTLSDLSERTGVLCFSRAWHNPVLWSHYADKHKGVCLGLDIPEETAMPVGYEPKRLKIDKTRDLNAGEIGERTMRRILATKFEDWRYEDEVRVFVRLDEPDTKTGLYYKDFGADLTLKEVIIGPRCHFSVSNFKNVLTTYNGEVRVIPSRLAFGAFKVIERKVVQKKKTKKKIKIKIKKKIKKEVPNKRLDGDRE